MISYHNQLTCKCILYFHPIALCSMFFKIILQHLDHCYIFYFSYVMYFYHSVCSLFLNLILLIYEANCIVFIIHYYLTLSKALNPLTFKKIHFGELREILLPNLPRIVLRKNAPFDVKDTLITNNRK
jgi:hypothetical protein